MAAMTDAAIIQRASDNASNILGLNQDKVSDHLTVVRIYLALNQLYGSNEDLMRHWIATYNNHLGYCPVIGIEGDNADDVLSYLESMLFL